MDIATIIGLVGGTILIGVSIVAGGNVFYPKGDLIFEK